MMSPSSVQKSTASAGPWREGRPSFKAFYPEIFGLTVLTIVFVVLAAKLSCSASTERPVKDAPKAVSVDAPFLGSVAFAQDAAIDAASENAATATDAVPENAATATDAAPENAATATDAAPEKSAAPKKKNKLTRVLWIWIGCLAIPVVLWIWRGWVWIYTIFSVRYKIVCDFENPKATTFLIVRGLLNKKTDSLHIAQIKDIQSSQTLWQKYIQGGVGSIRLTTSDLSDSVVELKNMEDPSRVFNAFDELRRHYWGRGGMQLNSGGVDGDNGEYESHDF